MVKVVMVWRWWHAWAVVTNFLCCLVEISKTTMLLMMGVRWWPMGWIWSLPIDHSISSCACSLVGTRFFEGPERGNTAIVTSPTLWVNLSVVSVSVWRTRFNLRRVVIVSIPVAIASLRVIASLIVFASLRVATTLRTVCWTIVTGMSKLSRLMIANGSDDFLVGFLHSWTILHEITSAVRTQRLLTLFIRVRRRWNDDVLWI